MRKHEDGVVAACAGEGNAGAVSEKVGPGGVMVKRGAKARTLGSAGQRTAGKLARGKPANGE
eukprot:350874-Chlamydomonas_euryale.AAC.9